EVADQAGAAEEVGGVGGGQEGDRGVLAVHHVGVGGVPGDDVAGLDQVLLQNLGLGVRLPRGVLGVLQLGEVAAELPLQLGDLTVQLGELGGVARVERGERRGPGCCGARRRRGGTEQWQRSGERRESHGDASSAAPACGGGGLHVASPLV